MIDILRGLTEMDCEIPRCAFQARDREWNRGGEKTSLSEEFLDVLEEFLDVL